MSADFRTRYYGHSFLQKEEEKNTQGPIFPATASCTWVRKREYKAMHLLLPLQPLPKDCATCQYLCKFKIIWR